MTALKPWLNYLNDSGVLFSHSTHVPVETALQTADAERMPASKFAKCVVYFSESGFGMAVVPATEFVDLTKLAKIAGVSYVRLANEAELGMLFPDCDLGAMPPFGNVYRMPVVVDYHVAANEFIAFTIGTHRDVVRMSFADYRKIAQPVIASIAVTVGLN
jgi:Ala-tRNA(Pro) deacylase